MGLGVIMGGILAYEGVRSRLRKPGREFLFLGLFAVLLLLSMAMSEYPYYSLEGIMEQYEPLGVQLSYLLLCLYAYEYVVTGGKGEPVENAFLVGCGIQCFIGYAQM